jgi:thiamine pyrophosphokinase
VYVSLDTNQYTTVRTSPRRRIRTNFFKDFQKAIKILTRGYKDTEYSDLDHLGPFRKENERQDIIIMSTMSGRIDQALGLLHELYRETMQHGPNSKFPAWLYFVSEQSVSFVLPVGKNVIRGIDPKKGVFRKYAGILPIYGPSRITIKGFEWDVQDWETKMGGMVSTSNHVMGDEVEVEVFDEMVLFTIELAELAE